MTDLVAVVPTRGRPENARRLARAFAELGTADTRLVFAVDSDDPMLVGYLTMQAEVRVCGPWQPMVPKLNQVAVDVAGEAFAVTFMGDDHLPRTPGFDTTILAALREMGTGVVYGDDLLQRKKLCTAWAMTSDIVRALGRMVPAPVEHMYCDNSVMDLATRAGCLRYLPDVVIEHLHPLAGKSQWDPGYWRVNKVEQFHRDEAAWHAWQTTGLTADVAAVRALREVAA